MKTRVQFLVAILLLIGLGAYLDQSELPNQQIVLQFEDKPETSRELNAAIAHIEKALAGSGAEHIQIIALDTDAYKITYFSKSDIGLIKTKLNNTIGIQFSFENNEALSTENPPMEGGCHIKISELKSEPSSTWDFEAPELVATNYKSDRFISAKVKITTRLNSEGLNSVNYIEELLKTQRVIVLCADFNFNTPQVRAGPALNRAWA